MSNSNYKVYDDGIRKYIASPDYNMVYRRTDGYTARWGTTKEDDPQWCSIGPELLDIEISAGFCPNGCPFCYKENSPSKPIQNMSFETFKAILDKMPPTVCQVALGLTAVKANPDLIRIMRYCNEKGVTPNFTLSGQDLDLDIAQALSDLTGGLAVSVYQSDKNICYNAVRLFGSLGVAQTNIHALLAKETLPFLYEVMEDVASDKRLRDLHAVVLLNVKPKGRAAGTYHQVTPNEYAELLKFALEKGVNLGSDSCGAHKLRRAFSVLGISEEKERELDLTIEPCESSCFSAYIDVNGLAWCCSFAEGLNGIEPTNVLDYSTFGDVWNSVSFSQFREQLLRSERKCPLYPEIDQ